LREVTGVEEEESFYTGAGVPPGSLPVQNAPWLTFSEPVAGQVRAHTFVTPLALNPIAETGASARRPPAEEHEATANSRHRMARPIGHYGDMTVGVYHRFGHGEVYYFGTSLGAAIHSGDAVANQIVRSILLRRLSPQISGGLLRPRWVGSDSGDALLVVINEHSATQTEVLTLPEGYDRPRDLLEEADLAVTDRRLAVTVPARDVVVFRLHRQ
jgi:hypothetical protein